MLHLLKLSFVGIEARAVALMGTALLRWGLKDVDIEQRASGAASEINGANHPVEVYHGTLKAGKRYRANAAHPYPRFS